MLAVFIIIKATSSPSTAQTANGVASGRTPINAPASITSALSSIPMSVFNSVGVAGQAPPFTATTKQPKLVSGKLPRMVYLGAEFCPYCAMDRWAMASALYRFGTFTNLKETSSANSDGDIPTLSFYGTTYSSPYLVFSGYEDQDRNSAALATVPKDVSNLYTTYDGTGTTPTKFDAAAGIPFIDIDNKFVSSGTPVAWQSTLLPALEGGGPGGPGVAQALHDPTSSVGTAISAKLLIAQANYYSAAICTVDGGKPADVCTSTGIKAALATMTTLKPVG